jgi:hypothetical protein
MSRRDGEDEVQSFGNDGRDLHLIWVVSIDLGKMVEVDSKIYDA